MSKIKCKACGKEGDERYAINGFCPLCWDNDAKEQGQQQSAVAEKPYIIHTHRGGIVSLPDKEGEICIEWDGEKEFIYFNRDDVLALLARFD